MDDAKIMACLRYQKKLSNEQFNTFAAVATELSDLKFKSAELKTTRDEAFDCMKRAIAEKQILQDKLDEVERRLSTVQTDLKKSEEARKTTEAELERAQRKVKTIVDVLEIRQNSFN